MELLGSGTRQAVGHSRILRILAGKGGNEAHASLGVRTSVCPERYVGTVERACVAVGRAQTEALGDIVAGKAVGSSGKGYHRHVGPHLLELRQLRVVGAEIVAPLRYAVRLVDGKKTYPELAPRVYLGKQALGRYVQQAYLAFDGGVEHLPVIALGLIGVHCGGRYSVGHKGLGLILHQRYQRRHHHGAPAVGEQGRNLIAQRLAAPGGHQHHRVAASGHSLYNLVLSGAKRAIAVKARKQCQGTVAQLLVVFYLHIAKVANFFKKTVRETV